ncbi:zinc finger BED domain-containing protein 6-like [Eublepharis macularius]|uniref:Zinc finger BED domain-containing protein 6-like n=1 Tax=Eublepharis macularius TaxID=481883 RepID=A0AA97K7M0_EUBMA|nr:zinc finger BED domain-containing protein 6-like [Eublepharis macularius]
MMPRHSRGKRAPPTASSRRVATFHLQEPHFPSEDEGGAPQEPAMETPVVCLQPVLKEEENCQSTVHDLFSYLKEKEEEEEEEEEEEATNLGAFSTAPSTSAQLDVKLSCHTEVHETLSYLKKEEDEEEGAEVTSSSPPPRNLPPPATFPVLPSYASPTVLGRKFHHHGGIEMLHFFTPLTQISAAPPHSKRGRERDVPTTGMDATPPPVPKKTTSAVWDYFTVDPREPCVAVCSTCQKRVRRGKDGGTRPGTTALHKHLKVHHGLHLPGVAVVPPSPLLPIKERPHSSAMVVTEPTPTFPLARPERNQPYYPPTHPTAIQLAQETAWMLAVDMQPLSYVESEGFHRLMATAQPRWKVPGRAFFATKAMPELSNVLSRAVRQAVACSVGRTIHIAIDLWSSNQTVSYMSVTGCWVADLGGTLSRQHATLSVRAFEGTCSAEDICQKLREVLQDWLYDLKTGGVISDDSSSVAKAVRDLRLRHVPCLAHCLKMVVKAFLAADTQVARLLKKARRICSRYNRSAAARRHLLEVQANLGVHQPVWPETPPRSNSTLKMLECLFRQRQAIGAMLDQDEEASCLHLTPADWKLVKCLMEILKPFEDAAALVTRTDATLCQALPLLWFLEEQLRALRTRYCQENNTGAHLTTQALDLLVGDSQLHGMKNSMICRVAAFLDPRFRDITTMKLGGADTADATLLREHIINLAKRSYVPPGPDAEFSQAGRSSPQHPSASSNPPGSAAWQFTMKRWRAITKSDPAMGLSTERGAAAALREVEEYLQDNVDHVGENADPMLYWQAKMGIWPTLFKVAVFHFGCPPTSAFSEDLSKISGSSSPVSYHQNLSPANVKMFTFIRKNRHLLPQDWRLSTGDLSSLQSAAGSREEMDMEEEEDLLIMDEEGQEEEVE